MGQISYMDKEITLMPGVYDPCDDTFLMLEAALEEVEDEDVVLEIGTGSGIISMFLADHARRVTATDINPHAVRCAHENGVSVVQADLLYGIRGVFDLIVFNPPYLPVPEDERNGDWLEKSWDGGSSGLDVINRFLDQAVEHLSLGGRVLITVSSLTDVNMVKNRLSSMGLSVEEVSSEKYFFERVIVLKAELP